MLPSRWGNFHTSPECVAGKVFVFTVFDAGFRVRGEAVSVSAVLSTMAERCENMSDTQRGSSLLCVSCCYTQDCAAVQNAKRVIFTVHDMAWTKRRQFFTGTSRDAVFPDASWQISAICKKKQKKTLMRECESQRNKVVVSCERSPLKNHRSE